MTKLILTLAFLSRAVFSTDCVQMALSSNNSHPRPFHSILPCYFYLSDPDIDASNRWAPILRSEIVNSLYPTNPEHFLGWHEVINGIYEIAHFDVGNQKHLKIAQSELLEALQNQYEAIFLNHLASTKSYDGQNGPPASPSLLLLPPDQTMAYFFDAGLSPKWANFSVGLGAIFIFPGVELTIRRMTWNPLKNSSLGTALRHQYEWQSNGCRVLAKKLQVFDKISKFSQTKSAKFVAKVLAVLFHPVNIASGAAAYKLSSLGVSSAAEVSHQKELQRALNLFSGTKNVLSQHTLAFRLLEKKALAYAQYLFEKNLQAPQNIFPQRLLTLENQMKTEFPGRTGAPQSLSSIEVAPELLLWVRQKVWDIGYPNTHRIDYVVQRQLLILEALSTPETKSSSQTERNASL